jgi:hypothetical protein
MVEQVFDSYYALDLEERGEYRLTKTNGKSFSFALQKKSDGPTIYFNNSWGPCQFSLSSVDYMKELIRSWYNSS